MKFTTIIASLTAFFVSGNAVTVATKAETQVMAGCDNVQPRIILTLAEVEAGAMCPDGSHPRIILNKDN